MMTTETFDEPHLLERNYRRRLYSDRLTELMERCGHVQEEWE